MTEDQRVHAAQIADEVERRIVIKYARGAEEHSGNLWELPPLQVLDESLNEVYDLAVYLHTLKQQLQNYVPTDLPVDDMA